MQFSFADSLIKESPEKLKKIDARIDDLRRFENDKSYSTPESFVFSVKDEETLKNVFDLVKSKKTSNLKTVFLAGIGGANLSFQSIHFALSGFYEKIGLTGMTPDFVFLDAVLPYGQEKIEELSANFSNPDEFFVLVVSKSGTTLETLSNADVVISTLEKKFGNIAGRILAITEEESPLWNVFSKKGASVFPVPYGIPDRFSAFSSTALIPLVFLGADLNAYLSGAREMLEICLSKSPENPARNSALILDYEYSKGVRILDSFIFEPRLEYLGKWYRQLGAESLGKEKVVSGERTHLGFTPTVSIGSTDLHSMLQLYLSSPNERFTQFIFADNDEKESIKKLDVLGDLADGFAQKNKEQISSAIYTAVKESYQKKKLIFSEILMDSVSEKEIGSYMVFKMMETVFLGHLWDINVFNQPNVEEYKRRAKELLTEIK